MNDDWIKTLKVGDDVIVSTSVLASEVVGPDIITNGSNMKLCKVEEITSDGFIRVDGQMYRPTGRAFADLFMRHKMLVEPTLERLVEIIKKTDALLGGG